MPDREVVGDPRREPELNLEAIDQLWSSLLVALVDGHAGRHPEGEGGRKHGPFGPARPRNDHSDGSRPVWYER